MAMNRTVIMVALWGASFDPWLHIPVVRRFAQTDVVHALVYRRLDFSPA